MNKCMNNGFVTIGLVMAFVSVIPVGGCRGKVEQAKSPATVAILGPFNVSVTKSVSLPASQVPDKNNPILGAAAFTAYNMAVILRVNNTAPGVASLSDKQLKVQVVDDTHGRHDALGYIPIEMGPGEGKVSVQTSVLLDQKADAITIKLLYTLSDGVTLDAEERIDNAGAGWTLHLPAGKPTTVSCVFFIPTNRKAVQVSISGLSQLIPLPATPPSVR
jgi:hypothetical protein